MRVLVAFDKFKDCLSATEACRIAVDAVKSVHAESQIDECPLADGGEGFAEILTRAAGGELQRVQVTGPRGKPVEAGFGLVTASRIPAAVRPRFLPPDARRVAIVEMAAASGLALLPVAERDPWQASTVGTGQLLAAAVAANVDAIVLGVGGSATNDLGLGALSALGLACIASDGRVIAPPTPASWSEVQRLSGRRPDLPPLFIACDVTNPLLGPHGAAAVYGPQKGLPTADVPRLDHAAARMALMICGHFFQPDDLMTAPGAGAAGGIGFGLMTAVGAKLVPGFDFVASWLDLDARLATADLVITGEGRFDETSLAGKGPGAVVARALAHGKPVHVFAGSIAPSARSADSRLPSASLHAVTPPGMDLATALREAPRLLHAQITGTLRSRPQQRFR